MFLFMIEKIIQTVERFMWAVLGKAHSDNVHYHDLQMICSHLEDVKSKLLQATRQVEVD